MTAAASLGKDRGICFHSEAEKSIWHIGLPEDRKFRRKILDALPLGFDASAAETYAIHAALHGKAEANGLLLALSETLKSKTLRLSASDQDLCDYAASRAMACERVTPDHAALVARNEGIEPPDGRTMTEAGKAARLACRYWWRRKVRASHGREVEGAAVRMGMVHKRAALYVSDNSLTRRRGQNRRNRKMLEAMQAVNELNQSFTLQQLSDLSVSNPKIRRGELMTRIAGFEDYANSAGHVALFVTWTCPSRMHSHHVTGERNPKHDGTNPREASQYLAAQWSKARAALGRKKVTPYGFRIAEPHHDGAPHWHMLLFVPADQAALLTATMRRYALQVDGAEPGAEKHRFKVVEIDRAKGSAAGYIAKYVAKNIDGYGVEVDLFGKDPKKSAERVAAWASTWGIRQFQQIGGPGVTVWRELRRVTAAPYGVLEDARTAADAGEWSKFVKVMGGTNIRRDARPVALHKSGALDKATGEIRINRYGEDSADQVRGVRAGAVVLPTRIRTWKISRAGTPAARPWSPVNNCTGGKNEARRSVEENQPEAAAKGGNAGPESAHDSIEGGICGKVGPICEGGSGRDYRKRYRAAAGGNGGQDRLTF